MNPYAEKVPCPVCEGNISGKLYWMTMCNCCHNAGTITQSKAEALESLKAALKKRMEDWRKI